MTWDGTAKGIARYSAGASAVDFPMGGNGGRSFVMLVDE